MEELLNSYGFYFIFKKFILIEKFFILNVTNYDLKLKLYLEI